MIRKSIIKKTLGAVSLVLAGNVLANGTWKETAPSSFNWAGPFVGIYGGYTWGHSNIDTDVGLVSNTSYFVSNPNIQSVDQSGSGHLHPSTGIGGIQIGNDWQYQQFVYGLVADFGSFSLHDNRTAANVTYPSTRAQYTEQTSMNTHWLFTARGRLGISPLSNVLVYTTGGLALTALEVSNSFSDNFESKGIGGGGNRNTRAGWSAGAGIEIALASHWTLSGEYLFVDFGDVSTKSEVGCAASFCANKISPFTTTADLSASLAKASLNYKF